MRFNSRELAQLAQQAASVDKEGVLYMKEKQDSIFKTKEVYIDRYFRLKGNLLFYFKKKETRAEPLGVLVIERCTVELDLEEEALNSFVVVCEGEDHPFKFAAISEEERDSWIQALHMASYECLKMQLQSLREQVQAKTGRDPVTLPDSTSTGLDLDIQTDSASEDPVLEISLSCKDLPCDSQGSAPNSLVLVHIIVPGQQQLWVHHNHTEISDKNCNPLFLKTIGFGDVNGVETSTRVRLTVYNVKERMTGTMAQLGQAIFTLQDVLMAPDMTLTLTLQSHDIRSKGKITMMAWINDNKVSLADLKQASSPTQTGSLETPRSARTMSTAFVRDSLRVHFDNVIKRSFRFATNNEAISLQVHEYMAEFQHSFNIPVQLLRIWIDEEKQKNSLLQDLGELWPEWEAPQITWITLAARTAEHYTNILDMLIEYKGPSFKRSVEKDRAELEFVAVNLHLQRMAVSTDNRSSSGVMYDVITTGASAAFSKKFKAGGLRRMLQQQRTSHTAESTLGPRTKLQRACALRNEATELRAEVVRQCQQLLVLVVDSASSASSVGASLQAAVASLTKKARELMGLCEDPVLCSAADMYVQAKRQEGGDGQEAVSSLRNVHPPPQSSDSTRRWSGSNFVKSPTTEPWEVTRLNLEAAVVCLVSLVEGVQMRDLEGRVMEVKEGVGKLQTFVDLVSAKISLFLTFLTMMENKDSIQKMHEIKYRRDIVDSQAITVLVAGVCAMVQHADFTSQHVIQQLQHCGLLIQWESLLSCFGDELGMIEDMAVAVDDLRFVTLQFVQVKGEEDADPTVSMGSHIRDGPNPDFNRHSLCVHIPVQEQKFAQLPKEMQEGQQISVCPTFFNIGINEDATFSETRFGSTVLQEHVNSESLSILHSYYESVASLHNDPVEKVGGPGSVSHLLKLLHSNVAATKKSKNVEVLHLASEICQRLHGIRITACKSGKDRTSMGVTLEMIQILQRDHDLAPHVFTQALDCLRSVGCRRENTYKNTGVRKYAFNRFQMLYIPKLYRAPGGTYGNIIT